MAFKSPLKLKAVPGSAVRQQQLARAVSPARKQQTGTPANPVEDFEQHFRQLDILLEYKLLYEHHPSGVYVLPSFKSIHEWHGVVFVCRGPYCKGIFKFIIYIPDTFPKTRPMLRFKSRLVHPLVHEVNRRFNLLRRFPTWEPHKDHIWHVLEYLKECLEDPFAQDDDPLQLEMKPQPKVENFEEKARECVRESHKLLYTRGDEEEDDYHSIHFKKSHDEVFKKARQLIHSGDFSMFYDEAMANSGAGFLSGVANQITSFLDSMVTT